MNDTDPALERRLRTAFRDARAVAVAPAELRAVVLAIPERGAVGGPWALGRRRGLLLLAATVALGAGAVGWALFGGGHTPDPDPSPPAIALVPTPPPSPLTSPVPDPSASADPSARPEQPSAAPPTGPLLPPVGSVEIPAHWEAAGTMAVARSLPTATLLRDGRVLVVGGFNTDEAGKLATAELWDPATRTFSSAGSMGRPRAGHAAALLDDGRVLIVGGDVQMDGTDLPAEAWNPATGDFEEVGTMPALPAGLTATTLLDGRVLIVGDPACLGQSVRDRSGMVTCAGMAAATWLWSPDGTWVVGPPLNEPREWHTATRLQDGRVLLVGNGSWGLETPESAEVYDPAADQFIRVDEPRDYTAGAQSATLLPDGRVLIAGGDTGDPNDPTFMGPLRSAELWNPRTGRFSRAGRMDAPRRGHLAAVLPDGRVLVVGGSGPRTADFHDAALASTEIWDPESRTFAPGPSMAEARQRLTLVTLPDGSLLVIGGDADANVRAGTLHALDTAELLDLGLSSAPAPSPTSP